MHLSRFAPMSLLLTLLPSAGPALAEKIERVEGNEVVANEVLVKFRTETNEGLADAISANNVEGVEGVTKSLVLMRSKDKDVIALMQDLAARLDVEYVEPNYLLYPDARPNDPQFHNQYALENTGQSIGGTLGVAGADIGTVQAWDISTGSAANVVAVVDTGIDYQHPDLAENIWSAPTDFTVTVGGRDISCPAGSHGFNAITNSCDPLDDNGHGTHCAGIIGAVGNNGLGVAGINWTASMMGAKFLPASGGGTTANAVKAIDFTIQAKLMFAGTAEANVRILSNSWGGGGFSKSLADAIARAQDNDILFVVAAGNGARDIDTAPLYPASYGVGNELVVAGTDNRDERYRSTNYGSNTVHLGAPGVRVLSTYRSSYAYLTGTSMATPQVAGAAALALSVCDLSTDVLKQLLIDTVDPIPSMSGITITGGRLNVFSALSACTAGAAHQR
jgi:subtilisin family serine protease